jgi:hypothetical protein
MSKPLVVSILHRLGKEEALRRLKAGLGSAGANFGHLFTIGGVAALAVSEAGRIPCNR